MENAKKLVPVGTPAVYHTSCVPLGEDLICGKSLDDRACFAILLDTVQRLAGEDLDVDVYVVGSHRRKRIVPALLPPLMASSLICVWQWT